jgi:hypothetical protein
MPSECGNSAQGNNTGDASVQIFPSVYGDRSLSAKLGTNFADKRRSFGWYSLVPTFSDRGVPRGQREGSLRPYSRFLDRSRYIFFQVAPQL